MLVREARKDDIAPACAVLEAAFRRPDEARLFRTLHEGDDLAIALVAVGTPSGGSEDAPVTGVAVLSHLVSPPNCVGLGPLAVVPEHSDRGIGKALIGESIERARRAGHGAIFVLGQPPYYTRFGFSVEAARPFRSEYPADFLMALELEPDAIAGGGELRYPPAFAGL